MNSFKCLHKLYTLNGQFRNGYNSGISALSTLAHHRQDVLLRFESDRSMFLNWDTRNLSKKAEDLYPPLSEDDLEESFTRGSGPGGQCVNKTSNCVMLKHLPTGVIIKCHEDRSCAKNRKTARLRMMERLDWHYNRENSIQEQEKRESSKLRQIKKKKSNERLAKLKAFKERERLD